MGHSWEGQKLAGQSGSVQHGVRAKTDFKRPKYRQPLFAMGIKLHLGRVLAVQGLLVSRHARTGHVPRSIDESQHSTS